MKNSRKDKKINVLFVDDSEICCSNYFNILSREGYNVITYGDEFSARQAIEEDLAWDIAIVDRELNEGGSGDDLIFDLHDLKPNNPIICISGYNDLPTGANTFILKPIFPNELLEKLKEFDYLFL